MTSTIPVKYLRNARGVFTGTVQSGINRIILLILSKKETRMGGVLLIECLAAGDPGSEGAFLKHLLEILEVPVQSLQLETKEQVISMLGVVPKHVEVIHFSTHGSIRKKKISGLWTPTGPIKLRDLENAQLQLGGKIVISSACQAGEDEFAKVFTELRRYKCYIAPRKSTSFSVAALFAHIVYHHLFILKQKAGRALGAYNERYANKYQWGIFE